MPSCLQELGITVHYRPHSLCPSSAPELGRGSRWRLSRPGTHSLWRIVIHKAFSGVHFPLATVAKFTTAHKRRAAALSAGPEADHTSTPSKPWESIWEPPTDFLSLFSTEAKPVRFLSSSSCPRNSYSTRGAATSFTTHLTGIFLPNFFHFQASGALSRAASARFPRTLRRRLPPPCRGSPAPTSGGGTSGTPGGTSGTPPGARRPGRCRWKAAAGSPPAGCQLPGGAAPRQGCRA